MKRYEYDTFFIYVKNKCCLIGFFSPKLQLNWIVNWMNRYISCGQYLW